MIEEWRNVKGYEGLYQVSNLGNVKSLDRLVCQRTKGGVTQCRLMRGRILKVGYDKDGYCQVALSKKGKVSQHKIHRLVASAFLDNPNDYPEINHIDSNPKNNKLSNLEYCNRVQNIRHSLLYGNRRKKK